jgi:Omp85 superfamily domain
VIGILGCDDTVGRRVHGCLARALPLLLLALVLRPVAAQETTAPKEAPNSSGNETPQRDLMDVGRRLFHLKEKPEKEKQLQLFIYPIIGSNPANGGIFGVGANGTYRNKDAATQLSTASLNAAYTTKKQLLIEAQSSLFTSRNRWNLVGDWRWQDTSENTFGLGSTPTSNEDQINYKFFRIYETAYRGLSPGLFAGAGYHLDRHDGIEDTRAQMGEETEFQRYGVGTEGQSTSSGVSLDLLYETRDNPINAARGVYAAASYRINPKFLGSDENWQSFFLEGRAYPHLPASGKNVLALWAFGWFTLSGRPPYLDLPAIGWDAANNSGRGYVQGRFRGRNMLYGEAEYRFGLRRDGLLGGVVFLNLTSVSGADSNHFGSVHPGYGLGLRAKLNKRNGSNVRIDYGWGSDGSGGVYLGLNEVF